MVVVGAEPFLGSGGSGGQPFIWGAVSAMGKKWLILVRGGHGETHLQSPRAILSLCLCLCLRSGGPSPPPPLLLLAPAPLVAAPAASSPSGSTRVAL